MVPETDTDLTDLMTEDEILMLESNNLNPEEYGVVALMGDLRVADPDATGGRVILSQGFLPSGIIQSKGALLTADGRAMNPFDGAIALPPAIRLIVRKDRLEPSFVSDLGEILKNRVEASHATAE